MPFLYEWDGSSQGWGTRKECFALKSLSIHYFEWPLQLWNNLFGRFSFFIRFSNTSWLKHVLKCFERWLKNYVSMCNFIEKESTWITIFI
jgi:hypothetical protein